MAIPDTLNHLRKIGFRQTIAQLPTWITLSEEHAQTVHQISFDASLGCAFEQAINQIAAAVPEVWLGADLLFSEPEYNTYACPCITISPLRSVRSGRQRRYVQTPAAAA